MSLAIDHHQSLFPVDRLDKMALESPEPVINMAPGLPNDDRTYLVGAKFNLRCVYETPGLGGGGGITY